MRGEQERHPHLRYRHRKEKYNNKHHRRVNKLITNLAPLCASSSRRIAEEMVTEGMGMPMPPPPPSTSMAMPGDHGMGGDGKRMMMHMSFFWGERVQVLFSDWPGERGLGMYAASLVFVLALAALAEALSAASHRLARRPGSGSGSASGPLAAALLALLHAARMGIAYLVMLAVMSFNVGVLIAAVVGHALGFLFARSGIFAKRSAPVDDAEAQPNNSHPPPSKS